MEPLVQQLDILEEYIPRFNLENKKVSSVNIGWQLDHSLRVINSVIKALETSDPKTYRYKLNMLRYFLLTAGSFPRGKGKAPRAVLPEGDVNEASLRKRLAYARENVGKINSFPPKANFPHPYFGQLNLKESKKFLRIHTKHHLKIIRDIINKR